MTHATTHLTETETMTTTNSPATVTIDRIEFVVESIHDADHHDANGHPNTAREMRQHGFVDLIVRRPQGKVLSLARIWHGDPASARVILSLGRPA